MKEIKIYVVKDEEGNLRPLAGVWKYDEYGKQSADDYVANNKLGDNYTVCTITENE